jgi:hypothetical protein
MPTTLQKPVSAAKERKSREPVLSAAEQTRFSWARLIQSSDELPPAYRSFFEARPAGEAFPYAVLTPTFAGFLRRETGEVGLLPRRWFDCFEEDFRRAEVHGVS